IKKKNPNPNKIKNVLFQSNLILSALCSPAILKLPLESVLQNGSFRKLVDVGQSQHPYRFLSLSGNQKPTMATGSHDVEGMAQPFVYVHGQGRGGHKIPHFFVFLGLASFQDGLV